MLSPHEFAALLLIDDAADPTGLDLGDLTSLVDRQLVALKLLASESRRARLTESGRSMLETIDRRH
ncbi:hypothetical protein [Burkholderia ubonensis]|uniref:hypothetical protein n=1 Tax=Burkholderia ubonensis TaxID=101571 RepID=UPI00075BC287|nr:hypothetical protein [Burkholderia ubonensis]KWK86219.1 hypothetical protein WM18_28820 [Burkholderia ubonensis]KWK88663.1 hypothetical protein WM17_03370 [Burkholderia ubonensis]